MVKCIKSRLAERKEREAEAEEKYKTQQNQKYIKEQQHKLTSEFEREKAQIKGEFYLLHYLSREALPTLTRAICSCVAEVCIFEPYFLHFYCKTVLAVDFV